jgi:hypothetical protein
VYALLNQAVCCVDSPCPAWSLSPRYPPPTHTPAWPQRVQEVLGPLLRVVLQAQERVQGELYVGGPLVAEEGRAAARSTAARKACKSEH